MRNGANLAEVGGAGRVLSIECATLSLPEAALILGIHRSTAWDLHKQGRFPVPVLRIGNRLRVTKASLERFLQLGDQDHSHTEAGQ